jgi:hypothetical protein
MFIIEDFPDVTMFYDLNQPDRLSRRFTKDNFINAHVLEMIDKQTLFVVTDFDGIDLSGHGAINLLYVCGIIDDISAAANNHLRIDWHVTNPYWKSGIYLSGANIHNYRVSPSGIGFVDGLTHTVFNYNLMGFVLMSLIP